MKKTREVSKTAFPAFKLVAVCWGDAWEQSGSSGSVEEVMSTCDQVIVRWTVGWLVGRTDNGIVLAKDLDPVQFSNSALQYGSITQIPDGMIIKVIKLCQSSPSKSKSRSASTPKPPSSSPSSPDSPFASEDTFKPEPEVLPPCAQVTASSGKLLGTLFGGESSDR